MHLAQPNHPCFFAAAQGRFGRIHLPVAPGCNISCAYCRREYDCVNENRPGVTSAVMDPEQALARLEGALTAMPYISVAGVAGPGDPFHRPERTLACLELVRRNHPELSLCVSTNGYNLGPYIPDLLDLGVGFVTITINAVEPDVGASIYSRVGRGAQALTGEQGAETLIERQFDALAGLKAGGVTVKVNTVVIPDVNQGQASLIAKQAASLGVDLMNLIPLIPLPGVPLARQGTPSPALMHRLRREAGRHLPQMRHCQRCRADAAGLLGAS